jgi:restriction system protein
MAVPDFQSLMLPVLQATASAEIAAADLRKQVADQLHLSNEDLAARLPSGTTTVFTNRVAWANVYLQRAGLIEKIGRGMYRATSAGLGVLSEHPTTIDLSYLQRFPSYTEWRRGIASSTGSASGLNQDDAGTIAEIAATPEEQIEKNYRTLTAALQAEVLDRVREMPPAFFERMVIDLLVKLGYGGGHPEMGQVTGKSGDGGIDGVIKEDALGLDVVYIQAKRYGVGHSVGQPEMRDFAGSLDGEAATKGIFITTGLFSSGAVNYVNRISKRIILIDGQQLAILLVEREVGVRVSEIYKLKRIDENYFSESQ